MEILEEKINRFISFNSGSGCGYGDGSGDGYGDGDGYGYGSGDGYGYGYGSGCGYGYGDGYGSGCGSGCGYGDGSGYGDCWGNRDGIASINSNPIIKIDGVLTIIEYIFRNVAKGYILNDDMTMDQCYVVKGHNLFAHGKTIEEAMQSLEEKIFDNMDTEEAIEEFVKKFEKDKKYKGTEFYTWHHNLTDSCKMGRDNFVKNHELDLNKKYSVKEFIELTENDYGGEIIKQLKEYYE